MTVLDTFYLLFKSDSAQAIKGNQVLEKSSKDLGKSIDETSKDANNLGDSFLKIAEGAAQAGAAIISLSAIKAGLINANNQNATLELEAKYLNQNAQLLNTYANAIKSAGGSREEFFSTINAINENVLKSGKELGPIDKYFANVRERVRAQTKHEQKEFAAVQSGFSPLSFRVLALESDEDFNKRIAASEKTSQVTDKETKSARELTTAIERLSDAKKSYWSKVLTYITPTIQKGLSTATEGVTELSQHPEAATAVAAGFTLASLWAGLKAATKVKNLFKIGKAAAGAVAAAPVAEAAVAGTAAVGLGTIGLGILTAAGIGAAGAWAYNKLQEPSPSPQKSMKSDMDFWLSKGYSREQSAAIVANMNRESGGDASNHHLDSDGKIHYGLFQWSPERVQSILSGTNIDVRSASKEDQLSAAAWEMKNGRPQFNDGKFRNLNGADSAAAYFSKTFLAPANGNNEALLRGKMAMDSLGQSSFSAAGDGKNISIKIDAINIETQATDAAGIARGVSEALRNQMTMVVNNYDDGVMK